ncbi:class I glutamine amidotransferase-like protein [Calocera viscosa TUFC12733]|uniref:Class I glutamine amidotransferase-like protein n=1 Tax=Calocera viscosa (strain TUFC12733) TaxID=1330018 RepID=A0A167HFP3_CALVF|nr:class I glutamine amidotransferase-like protein [Calocera viscosa TUFC12733]
MAGFTQGTPRVLVYSATAGYRHESIPVAIDSFKRLGPQYGIEFDFTEDKTWFNETGLAVYDCILFLSNSDEVLDEPGKEAFDAYLEKGGNFVGVHAASACLFTTQFFGQELGAWFDYHPAIQNATIVVLDPTHPSTAMLPARWEVYDEMYNFKSDPRAVGAKVILTVDESSYVDNGTRLYDQGTPHPIAWYQDVGAAYTGNVSGSSGGRSWYTSLGHTNDTWQNATYLSHVMEGLKWALESNTTRAFNPQGLVGNAAGAANTTTGGSSATGAQTAAPSASGSHSGAKQVAAGVVGAGMVAAAVGAALV